MLFFNLKLDNTQGHSPGHHTHIHKRQTRRNTARQAHARPRKPRQGQTRPDKRTQGRASRDKARQAHARPDKARQGQTRPDKARQGQTRPDKAAQGQTRPRTPKHSTIFHTRKSVVSYVRHLLRGICTGCDARPDKARQGQTRPAGRKARQAGFFMRGSQ